MPILRLMWRMSVFILLALSALIFLSTARALRLHRINTLLKRTILRGLLSVCAMDLHVHGKAAQGNTLLVSNHQSYIDVAMIWVSAGDVIFTPKSDVRSWPVIGYIVMLFDVVFVDRSPRRAQDALTTISAAKKRGIPICVFPEATTNDGTFLHPFKPALFTIALPSEQQGAMLIQPVSIRYTHVNYAPIDATTWPKVAWYGDSSFFSHLQGVMQLRKIRGEVIYHPPFLPEADDTRKTLAAKSEQIIRSSLPHLNDPHLNDTPSTILDEAAC